MAQAPTLADIASLSGSTSKGKKCGENCQVAEETGQVRPCNGGMDHVRSFGEVHKEN